MVVGELRAAHLRALRHRAVRSGHGQVFAEGLRFVHAALASGAEILGAAVCPKLFLSAPLTW